MTHVATPIFLPQNPVSISGLGTTSGGRVVVSVASAHNTPLSLPPQLMGGAPAYQVNTTAASAPFTIPGVTAHMGTPILTAVKSEPARNPDYTLDPDVESYVCIKTDPADPQNKLKYTCNACQFSPKQLNLLVEHINAVHLNRKNLSCNLCNFKTSRKKSLTAHINDIHIKEKKTARKGGFVKHVMNDPSSTNVFQCRHCQFVSKKESDYKGHMLIVHRLTEAVELPEDASGDQKAINSDQLIAYDESFDQGYCCSVCKYSPTSMRYLRDHIRKVHLSKQIKCPYCELKTKRKADLIKHIRRLHPESIEIAGGGGLMSNMVVQTQQHGPQTVTIATVQAPPHTISIPTAQLPQIPIQLPTQPLKLHHTTQTITTQPPTAQQLSNDPLLNAALKSEIPITLHLQYPHQLQSIVQMPQQPVIQQQPVQISLPTIDTSAILNSYTSAGPHTINNVTITNAGGASINHVQHPIQQQQVQQVQSQPTTAYKKGSHQSFDPNTKVDDLIVHNSAYPFGMGCLVCNYAPQTLRYLRDHIRKVHLSKLFPCTYCDLKTKRKADLKRHIQRIHEDPKRQANQQQQQQPQNPQQAGQLPQHQQMSLVKQEVNFIPQ